MCPVWRPFRDSVSGCRPCRLHARAISLQALMQQADGQYAAIAQLVQDRLGISCHAVSSQAPVRLRVHAGPPDAAAGSGVLVGPQEKEPDGETRGAQAVPLHAALWLYGCGMVDCQSELRTFRLNCTLANIFAFATKIVVSSPAEALEALFQRVLPGLTWSFDDAGTHDNRHQLHGNSVKRHQLAITDVKEDLKWKTEMPPEYSRAVLALSYFLRLRYGY